MVLLLLPWEGRATHGSLFIIATCIAAFVFVNAHTADAIREIVADRCFIILEDRTGEEERVIAFEDLCLYCKHVCLTCCLYRGAMRCEVSAERIQSSLEISLLLRTRPGQGMVDGIRSITNLAALLCDQIGGGGDELRG